MNMDAVIGCDAVDAGDQWLRLRTASGVMRTLTWSAIKIAGMGGNHEGQMQIQDVTEKVAPYFATHDSLWIVYAEGGLAQVMIEKTSPKRDAILTTFAQQLRIGWRGDELTSNELTDAMFEIPLAAASKGLSKKVVIAIAVFAAVTLLMIVAAYVVGSHASP